SISSHATRVYFSVRGFSTSGGAPAINWRARRAASTTYANWLSGALVCTVIVNLSLQMTPEDFPPTRGGVYSNTATRLRLIPLHVRHVPRLHSRRNNRNTCRTLQSLPAPSPGAAQFPRPHPAPEPDGPETIRTIGLLSRPALIRCFVPVRAIFQSPL